jgi:phosphohistidine phosphatase
MQLFVFRHAIAAALAPGDDDALRPLTKKGTRRFRKSVIGLGILEVQLSAVLRSPWRRAIETSQLLTPLLAPEASMMTTAALCRSPDVELLREIAECGKTIGQSAREGCGVAVVGHEPFLGELIGWLTAGDPRIGESLILKKGSVIWLAGSPVAGGMTLRASLPPRVLRALGS